MNWKIKIITIFLSASLIACEDKAAVAKAEAAKAEAAKAEAAKAEAAKAEATEKHRHEVIEGVMDFLRDVKISVKFYRGGTKDDTHITYKDFAYDYHKNILSFKDEGTSFSSGQFSSWLGELKVDVHSVKPVIQISDYDTKIVVNQPKKVTLIAMVSRRYAYEQGVLFVTKESIEKQSFDAFEKRAVDFVVTPDLAPRLKSALEDLLKANGIALSKY